MYIVYPGGCSFTCPVAPSNSWCGELSPDGMLQCTRIGKCGQNLHVALNPANGEELGEWYDTDTKVGAIYDRSGNPLAYMPPNRITNLGATGIVSSGTPTTSKAAPIPKMNLTFVAEEKKRKPYAVPTQYEPVDDFETIAPDVASKDMTGLPTWQELNERERKKGQPG